MKKNKTFWTYSMSKWREKERGGFKSQKKRFKMKDRSKYEFEKDIQEGNREIKKKR